MEAWHDDLYGDFDALYRSMCTDDRERFAHPEKDIDRTMRLLVESRVPGPLSPNDFMSAELDPSLTGWPDVGDQARAESRDTYQSLQNGPALVEETTLTDLEDEISSTLMATKEAAKNERSFYHYDQQSRSLTRPQRHDNSGYQQRQLATNQIQPLGQMIQNDLTKYHRRFR